METLTENRSVTRLPCCIAVTHRSVSASLGEIQNISLDGVFVATDKPLGVGTVFSVVFTLGERGDTVRPEVEVVHATIQGMGLRFLKMSGQDNRRIRRYVAELNQTTQQMATSARLRDAESRTTAPIDDPVRIRALLTEGGKSVSEFSLIPETRSVREVAHISNISDTTLSFTCKNICVLKPEESLLVLYNFEFVSYSFQSRVVAVRDSEVAVTLPAQLFYSERRTGNRNQISVQVELALPLPWRGDEVVRWPVYEMSPGGLSFRTEPKEVYFWPGSELPGAMLMRKGQEEPIVGAIVKHLTPMQDDDGTAWLRIGISYGAQRESAVTDSVETADERRAINVRQKAAKVIDFVWSHMAYIYHTRISAKSQRNHEMDARIVKFKNRDNKPIVAALNTTFQSSQIVRAPLVVVVPGFAIRKETYAGLAMTLMHNFRRNDREIAVLRLDGSNNLGESYKDPGCEGEGKHTLKFLYSNVIDDFLGALDWAGNNSVVEPTDIIVVSASIASIGVRRVMTSRSASMVTYWLSLMGHPEATQPVANAMGNSNPYENFTQGIPNGVITLFGCLIDADRVCQDLKDRQLATQEDARRDMAQVKADCTWIVGKYDALIDPARVEDLMTVKAPGKREIITVNSGHLPRSSDQALAQFSLMTRYIWRHLFDRDLDATMPSRGWVAAAAEREWHRVRRARPENEGDYWRAYLMGEDDLGYDVWKLTVEYRQLISDQVRLAEPAGKRFLDLGAGTGNITELAVDMGPASMTALDLVPDALEKLRRKLPENAKVDLIRGSIEGSARIAMRRWLEGEMANVLPLASRLPGRHASALRQVYAKQDERMHAVLRGSTLPVASLLRDLKLSATLEPQLRDINLLARLTRGLISESDAEKSVSDSFTSVIKSAPGLPFETGSFDTIVCSIVLSYLRYPDDALSEMRRILAPGGTLVISTIMPDPESSQIWLDTIEHIKTAPPESLPKGFSRDRLIESLRIFSANSANLIYLEEEGIFQFWDEEGMATIVRKAGFEAVETHLTYGKPAQAVIVRCRK